MTDLRAVLDALYAELPARFIAERGAAVKAARADGDSDLAREVGSLTKPSIGAWAVNMLVRHRGDLIDGFLALGESLRDAQDDLDSTALRQLAGQRRKVVEQLAGEAEKLGAELGQKVGPSARDDVEQTLQAALADPDAAVAVQTGRLIRALSSTGFDAVDLEGAVAGGDTAPAPRAAAKSATSAKKTGGVDDLEEARQKRARELDERTRDKDQADRERESAAGALAEADSAYDDSRERRDSLREQQEELQRQLDEIGEQLTKQSSELRHLATTRDDAADALTRAERAADRAATRLEALTRKR